MKDQSIVQREEKPQNEEHSDLNLDVIFEEYPFLQHILNQRILAYIQWTENAEIEIFKTVGKKEVVPLSVALRNKIQNSIAGQYIKEFNNNEVVVTKEVQEAKLNIDRYSLASKEFPACLSRHNDLVDNVVKILESLVRSQKSDKISLKDFIGALTHIRLTSCKIGFIDEALLNMTSIKALILTGNYIEKLPFHCLPKSLRFLELSGNLIDEVNSSNEVSPLLFLGLSLNKISDSNQTFNISTLHLLTHLDLRDNDITFINDFIKDLKPLSNLRSLGLQGNPCSVALGYLWMTVRALPNLDILDGMPIQGKQRLIETSFSDLQFQKNMESAELRISIFRIMGLTKPKTSRGATGYYEIETELPLLDEKLEMQEKYQLIEEVNLFPKEDYISEFQSEQEKLQNGKTKILSTISKASSTLNKSPRLKKINEKTSSRPKTFRQTVLNSQITRSNSDSAKGVTIIKSTKILWSQIIRPKNPIFGIPVKREHTRRLRDTLRTIISLRLYYVEVSQQTRKKIKSHEPVRTLVANIPIPAEVTHWCEDYTGFIWDSKFPVLAELYPKIGDLKFAPAGKVYLYNPTHHGISRRDDRISISLVFTNVLGVQELIGIVKNGEVGTTTFPVPRNLTCHIGISLVRLQAMLVTKKESVKH